MTDKTTIAVSKTAKAKAKESKRDNETWNEYIQRCTEEGPEIVEFVEHNGGGIEKEVLCQMRDEIITTLNRDDYANEEHIRELSRKLDTIEQKVEHQNVKLEATEYGKIAEEVVEALR